MTTVTQTTGTVSWTLVKALNLCPNARKFHCLVRLAFRIFDHDEFPIKIDQMILTICWQLSGKHHSSKFWHLHSPELHHLHLLHRWRSSHHRHCRVVRGHGDEVKEKQGRQLGQTTWVSFENWKHFCSKVSFPSFWRSGKEKSLFGEQFFHCNTGKNFRIEVFLSHKYTAMVLRYSEPPFLSELLIFCVQNYTWQITQHKTKHSIQLQIEKKSWVKVRQ